MSLNPFAGLMAGIRGARADDEKPEDEAARQARRAEEDRRREEEDARRAEEDRQREEENARRAEEDDGAPDDKDGKGRKAKEQDEEVDAEDGDDESEKDMDEKESKAFRRGLAVGRARENTRSSRIFLTAANGGRADLAATLAFTTRNSSAESARILSAAGSTLPTEGSRLHRRMSQLDHRDPGQGAPGKSVSKNEVDDFVAAAAAAASKAGIA